FGSAEALFSGPGLTVNANVNGTAGMSVFGGGSVSFPNANSYTGTTRINSGTIILSNPNAFGNGTRPLVIQGGTLQAGGSVAIPNPYTLNQASITFGGSLPMDFSGPGKLVGNVSILNNNTGGTALTGNLSEGDPTAPVASLSLTSAGTTVLLLNGNNTYSGGTSIALNATNAYLMVGGNNALGTGPISLTSGALIGGAGAAIGSPLSPGGSTLANPIQVPGTAFTFSGSAPIILTGAVSLQSSVTLSVNNNTTITSTIGEVGGAKTLTINGTGTLNLPLVST